ncbi:MAG: hypothetical protein R2845_02645 [Thermomicrobiales bacterium]
MPICCSCKATAKASTSPPTTGNSGCWRRPSTRRDPGVYLLTNFDREFVALVHLNLATGSGRLSSNLSGMSEAFSLAPDGESAVVSINKNGTSKPFLFDFATGNER